MFNVTVLKMKDILKYFSSFALAVMIIILIGRGLGKYKENLINDNSNAENSKSSIIEKIENKVNLLSKNNMQQALDLTIPVISNVNKEYRQIAKDDKEKDEEQNQSKNVLKGMLGIQISAINGMENIEKEKNNKKDEEENNNNENSENQNGKVEEAGVTTEVITQNPIKDGSNTNIRNVKIKNETNYQLTEDLFNTNDLVIDNKNIVLFHTHSCESYTSSKMYPYTPTGNYRTTDLNYTVTRVGTELETYLKKYNYNVIHNMDYHDYPAYNGSYTRSLKTVENILQTTPSDIIIDIHRDAIGSRNDYAPTVKIGDEEAAQLMFVIGTDEGGLWHPNWRENLKFAIKVQEKAEEMYPGLFKTMMVTTSRYNQHTGKYASIIEVGATGNTLEQCLVSMKYLAEVMHEVIK